MPHLPRVTMVKALQLHSWQQAEIFISVQRSVMRGGFSRSGLSAFRSCKSYSWRCQKLSRQQLSRSGSATQ